MTNPSIVSCMDISASMGPGQYNYLPLSVSAASQFVYIMNVGDSLGVTTFGDSAWISYPSGAAAVAVLTAPAQDAAVAVLGALAATRPSTNISAALSTSAGMLTAAAAPKAIVLLSDGEWNAGTNPTQNLPAVPVYTIGLGASAGTATLQAISTGTGGKWHSAGTIDQLQDVYNEIIGQTSIAAVAANQQQAVSQYRHWTLPGTVPAGADHVTLGVSWSNTAVTWTAGVPTGNQVGGSLRDPTGTTQPLAPTSSGTGFVVFKIPNPMAGTWQLTLVSAVSGSLGTTQAIFTPTGGPSLEAEVSQNAVVGEPLSIKAQVRDASGAPIADAVVTAMIERPTLDPEEAVAKHRDRLDAVELAAEQGEPTDNQKMLALQARLGISETLLPYQHLPLPVAIGEGGDRHAELAPEKKGAHILRLTATGHIPGSGPFSLSRRISIWADHPEATASAPSATPSVT